MALVDSLLPEFDHEMATTHKCLERLPDDKWTFKPHEKSMDLGALASHLAAILLWVPPTAKEDEFDMNPAGGAPFKSPHATPTGPAPSRPSTRTSGRRARPWPA